MDLQNALSKINKLEGRLKKIQAIDSDLTLSEKFISKRNIITLDYSDSDTKENSMLTYSKLSNYIRTNNFLNLYQGGFIYNLKNSILEVTSIFESVKIEKSISAPFLTEINEGYFLCLNYKVKNRNTAINILLETIKNRNLSSSEVFDVYLVSDLFNSDESRNELQIRIN